jgi:hypothetical protein
MLLLFSFVPWCAIESGFRRADSRHGEHHVDFTPRSPFGDSKPFRAALCVSVEPESD